MLVANEVLKFTIMARIEKVKVDRTMLTTDCKNIYV